MSRHLPDGDEVVVVRELRPLDLSIGDAIQQDAPLAVLAHLADVVDPHVELVPSRKVHISY